MKGDRKNESQPILLSCMAPHYRTPGRALCSVPGRRRASEVNFAVVAIMFRGKTNRPPVIDLEKKQIVTALHREMYGTQNIQELSSSRAHKMHPPKPFTQREPSARHVRLTSLKASP